MAWMNQWGFPLLASAAGVALGYGLGVWASEPAGSATVGFGGGSLPLNNYYNMGAPFRFREDQPWLYIANVGGPDGQPGQTGQMGGGGLPLNNYYNMGSDIQLDPSKQRPLYIANIG